MFKDELTHSYIIRKHLQWGVKNIRNVVTSSGSWTAAPYILPEMLDQFPKSSDPKIINSLLDLRLITKEDLSNYTSQKIFSILYHFYGKASGPYSTMRKGEPSTIRKNNFIVYCRECMAESIKNNGVGYFKTSWTLNLSCEKHDNSFYIASSGASTINGIRKIISGKDNPNHTLIKKSSQDDRPLYKEILNDIDLPLITPCLKDAIQEFAIKNHASFSDGQSIPFIFNNKKRTITYDCPKWHRHGCYFTEDEAIHDIVSIILTQIKSRHKKLWENEAQKVTLFPEFRPRGIKLQPKTIYKSKKLTCQECHRYHNIPLGCILAKHPHHIDNTGTK